jgi:hypothetical protein
MNRIAIALFLATMSGGIHAADPAAEALDGAWLVNVTDQPRERLLVVSGAKSDLRRIHVASAVYGWIDARGREVDAWQAEIAGDTIRLSFVTSADSVVKVTFKADDPTVAGTLLSKAGKTYDVRMTRLPAEEIAALRAAAVVARNPAVQKAAADRNAKLRLLYVGAVDCPGCAYYNHAYIRSGKLKKIFPALSQVEYVDVTLAQFRQRLTASDLPNDLRWVLAQDAAGNVPLRKRGVPFYAAIAGESIIAQGHGETGLVNLVVPALGAALEARRGAN